MSGSTRLLFILLLLALIGTWMGLSAANLKAPDQEEGALSDGHTCEGCHRKTSPALVLEWERSLHAQKGIGCVDCHGAKEGDPDAWLHHGRPVSMLVTPKDCAGCHSEQYEQFTASRHARAGEIVNSLDNVLAERAAGMPGNNATAVNGCWQCHGSIVTVLSNDQGEPLRKGEESKPLLCPDTWPNSGIGRINPDGSKGLCHACHSRHSFQVKLSRSPENCGKCHLGPDHPQMEVYQESKHGIAFYANRQDMALDREGEWVLGRDYSAAPTCATCHIGSHMTQEGVSRAKSHDVGERISWTLRPVISTKINDVVFEDGSRETYPDTLPLPREGEELITMERILQNGKLIDTSVRRKVSGIVTWQERREAMKGVCTNCHGRTHVNQFYQQFDSLVVLYNEKFARPAQALMDSLISDGVLNPRAPFQHELQWVFYELWHHEGRRARHGASMMGPDYTHWHGMYEVAKHFYLKFLPGVVKTAQSKSPELGRKYQERVQDLLSQEEHLWLKGLAPEEADALQRTYRERYGQ